ncbi:ComEC/Rec2 family competence protein [Corynebacterium glaucum]|uniref:ComEC/Rec2 family competence protein n=1 Tax=Corynebacterium glaucum TaxID=187491 RepID=UPI00265AE9B6|nr:ComEC/Rec2 family competence protein [Corynebacterium glaucum]
MSELRLVPAALVVWFAAIAVLTQGLGVAVVGAALVAGGCFLVGERGQAVLISALGFASAIVAAVRTHIAAGWDFAQPITATVSGQPKQLENGSWLTRLAPSGHPSTLAVFSDSVPDGIAAGTTVTASGTLQESGRVGVNPYVLSGTLELEAPPTGLAALALRVRAIFGASVEATVGPSTRGLIPGMVLGDTTAQTAAEEQAYIDTGLSHLSAVSGSNVAIVTTAAVLLATALRLNLYLRLASAAVALLSFAALVGPEPSVLRASVTGLVGLVAVVASTRAEPLHALCLSVIGLVLVDTDLAVHYGFALSVVATAGIVALSPLLYTALAVTGWPDILVRALAVAIAADVVTMPIVALMAGRVSLVSVAANVLVAPVVAPITILGLVAVVLSLLPGGLEVPLLWCIEPMAWWVHTVARVGAGLPVATMPAAPLTALVLYGWVVAGIVAKRTRLTLALTAVIMVVPSLAPQAPVVDQSTLRAHVVASKTGIEPVPPGTQLVVVLESGPPTKRPAMTPQGVPVIYPNRDGPVTLRADGTREP